MGIKGLGIKSILKNFSPAYNLLKGNGLGGMGGGLLSQVARKKKDALGNDIPEGAADAVASSGMGAATGMKKGGKVKKMSSGGYRKVADGIATKGKTKGRMV